MLKRDPHWGEDEYASARAMVDLPVNGLVHTKRGQHWPSHHGQSRHHQGCPEHHRSSMQRRRKLGRRLPKTRMQRGSTHGCSLTKTRTQRGSTRSPLMQNLTPIYFWVDCLAKDFVLNKQNRSRNRRRLKRDQKEEQKQSRNTSRNRSRKGGKTAARRAVQSYLLSLPCDGVRKLHRRWCPSLSLQK